MATPEDFEAEEFNARWVNWPAEDVRPVAATTEGESPQKKEQDQ